MLETVPAVAVPIPPFGSPKFAWLKKLNDSTRICSRTLSVTAMLLDNEKSHVDSRGPVMMLRPELPKANPTGETKAFVSNQRSTVRSP